jgi:hypothetical protein
MLGFFSWFRGITDRLADEDDTSEYDYSNDERE